MRIKDNGHFKYENSKYVNDEGTETLPIIYYESHITTEYIDKWHVSSSDSMEEEDDEDNSSGEPVLTRKYQRFNNAVTGRDFRVADLKKGNNEQSRDDSFCSGRSDSYQDLLTRMKLLVKDLRELGIKVYRYKIEVIVLDSKDCDEYGLLLDTNSRDFWVDREILNGDYGKNIDSCLNSEGDFDDLFENKKGMLLSDIVKKSLKGEGDGVWLLEVMLHWMDGYCGEMQTYTSRKKSKGAFPVIGELRKYGLQRFKFPKYYEKHRKNIREAQIFNVGLGSLARSERLWSHNLGVIQDWIEGK